MRQYIPELSIRRNTECVPAHIRQTVKKLLPASAQADGGFCDIWNEISGLTKKAAVSIFHLNGSLSIQFYHILYFKSKVLSDYTRSLIPDSTLYPSLLHICLLKTEWTCPSLV